MNGEEIQYRARNFLLTEFSVSACRCFLLGIKKVQSMIVFFVIIVIICSLVFRMLNCRCKNIFRTWSARCLKDSVSCKNMYQLYPIPILSSSPLYCSPGTNETLCQRVLLLGWQLPLGLPLVARCSVWRKAPLSGTRPSLGKWYVMLSSENEEHWDISVPTAQSSTGNLTLGIIY